MSRPITSSFSVERAWVAHNQYTAGEMRTSNGAIAALLILSTVNVQ